MDVCGCQLFYFTLYDLFVNNCGSVCLYVIWLVNVMQIWWWYIWCDVFIIIFFLVKFIQKHWGQMPWNKTSMCLYNVCVCVCIVCMYVTTNDKEIREEGKEEIGYDQLSPASGCSSPSPCVSDVQSYCKKKTKTIKIVVRYNKINHHLQLSCHEEAA